MRFTLAIVVALGWSVQAFAHHSTAYFSKELKDVVKIEGMTVYVPVSVDTKVMDTVLRTYNLDGIEYRFEQGNVGAISRVVPHEHPHPAHRH